LEVSAEAEQTIADQQVRIVELERMTLTDELTGLTNRRGFTAAMGRALAEARRHEESGVLALFDLDGFKAVNDTYGHQAGDEALRSVAASLDEGIRSTDIAARLGGDEFAVLMTRAEPRAATARLRNLRERLCGIEQFWGGKRVVLGASLGIAAFGPGADPEDLFAAADRSLYADKRSRAHAC
jgi:diguanylate cyclase (GGDEF)-like protein